MSSHGSQPNGSDGSDLKTTEEAHDHLSSDHASRQPPVASPVTEGDILPPEEPTHLSSSFSTAAVDAAAHSEGKLLIIYICNFHVLSHLLLIYMCKLHWNQQWMLDLSLRGTRTLKWMKSLQLKENSRNQVIFFSFTCVISMF